MEARPGGPEEAWGAGGGTAIPRNKLGAKHKLLVPTWGLR